MSITRFPHGISSFGAPVLPDLYPFLVPHPSTLRQPQIYVVDDVNGSDDNNGRSLETAYGRIQTAIDDATDGVGTNIYVLPGEYNERLTVNKRNIRIIGASGGHPGITRITGPGTGTAPTIDVTDGFARGFVLANVHLDTAPASGTSIAAPCLRITTNDTGTLGATSDDYHFHVTNVHIVGDNLATQGITLVGGTMGLVENCVIAGVINGLCLAGSANNNPADLHFRNIRFYNNTTADICTLGNHNANVIGTVDMDSIMGERMFHFDRGGTPVTNYVNFNNAGTHVNVVFFDCYAARDVGEATLLSLAVDDIWQGYSAAGAEFIIGS